MTISVENFEDLTYLNLFSIKQNCQLTNYLAIAKEVFFMVELFFTNYFMVRKLKIK